MSKLKDIVWISAVLVLLFYVNTISTSAIQKEFKSQENDAITSSKSTKSNLLTSYIPVAMQMLSYCSEMVQYEPVMTTTKKPVTSTTTEKIMESISETTSTTTSKTTAETTTTEKATTASIVTTTKSPTTIHNPGNVGPAKPPPTPINVVATTTENYENTESTETLLWDDKNFLGWFLQSKFKQIKLDDDYDLQILDPLPQKLLYDIEAERYELPTILLEDNVNEFRRLYDDSFGDNSRGADTPTDPDSRTNNRKKKVPPTKAYIHMLMLYDLLKREAKKLMLNKYEGYSVEVLKELGENDFESAQQQLHFVLSKLLERKDVDKSDIISRTTSMIQELENPSSVISMALSSVPYLPFLQ